MAIDNLGIRFSEETYASRSQVAHSLGTNLIDPFWNQILAYRKNYQVVLTLKDISKMSYNITLCKKVNDACVELSQKIERYSKTYNEKITKSLNKNNYYHDTIRQDLLYVAKANNIFVNEVALNNIIYHRSNDPVFTNLINYFSACEYIYSNPTKVIDDSYVANIYGALVGETELQSFYRVNEINSFSQKVIINREYAGAPVNQIEGFMESLYDFINNYKASNIIKSAVCYYMINYIKPFANFNAEMSSLISRAILNNGDSSQLFVPFASLLAEKQSDIALAIRESQRSRDLTYIVLEVIDVLNNSYQFSLDLIARLQVEGAQQSYLMGEDEEKIANEFGKETLQAKAQTYEVPQYQEQKSNEQPKVEEEKAQTFVKPTRELKRDKVYYEDSLSEKELKRQAEDMVESDPMIRPNQAHFFVRHNTPGRYYTIQQYKRAEHCVYETARTSMDNLAKQGYYKREQVKNKFVYTPMVKE